MDLIESFVSQFDFINCDDCINDKCINFAQRLNPGRNIARNIPTNPELNEKMGEDLPVVQNDCQSHQNLQDKDINSNQSLHNENHMKKTDSKEINEDQLEEEARQLMIKKEIRQRILRNQNEKKESQQKINKDYNEINSDNQKHLRHNAQQQIMNYSNIQNQNNN